VAVGLGLAGVSVTAGDPARAAMIEAPTSLEEFLNAVDVVAEVEGGPVLLAETSTTPAGQLGFEELRSVTVRRSIRGASAGQRLALLQTDTNPPPDVSIVIEDAAGPVHEGWRAVLFLLARPAPPWTRRAGVTCVYAPAWGPYGVWTVEGSSIRPLQEPSFTLFRTNRDAARAKVGTVRHSFTLAEARALPKGPTRHPEHRHRRACT
jgi:hypothetical protein